MPDDNAHLIDLAEYLKNSHDAEVVLLTCLDFRFFGVIAEFMEGSGYAGKYDHLILAGAALGAVVPEKEHWHRTFFDHLELALQLHPNIRKVIVLEHRDCGAYGPRGFGLLPDNPTREQERQVHFEQVAELENVIRRRFPNLDFTAGLLEKPEETDTLTCDQLV